MKTWNKNICLTNRICILFVVGVLFSTLMLASVWSEEEQIIIIEQPIKQVEKIDSTTIWVPTAEDIAYQDSMYVIIQNTQDDITDIKKDIVLILERLDYKDGSYDSIRYVKGGEIDKRRNQ
tara:strand:+ start:2439 stop:2801 length:363 start_codon:yes stop_codon:yes gene_type:complete